MTATADSSDAATVRLHLERDGARTSVALALPPGAHVEGDALTFTLQSGDVRYVAPIEGLARPASVGFALLADVEQELHVEVLALRGTVTAWVVVFDGSGARARVTRVRLRRGLVRLELGSGEAGEVASFALRLADDGALRLGELRLVRRPTFRVPSAPTCPPPTTSSSSSR